MSFIPLCVSTLRLIFHSKKCDVYQFLFHLLLCFHFLILNNFSNFLLVSIPTMIDQSNKLYPVDSHHLVLRAWLSRFGIGNEVYYTKCLTEGHPCFVAFDYGSENNVVSQRLLEKLQLPATFHLDQAWIKFSTWQCVKEVLCDIAAMESCHLHLGWAWLLLKHSILMNVLFIWGMRDIKRSRNLWHQDKSVRINVCWWINQKKKE